MLAGDEVNANVMSHITIIHLTKAGSLLVTMSSHTMILFGILQENTLTSHCLHYEASRAFTNNDDIIQHSHPLRMNRKVYNNIFPQGDLQVSLAIKFESDDNNDGSK